MRSIEDLTSEVATQEPDARVRLLRRYLEGAQAAQTLSKLVQGNHGEWLSITLHRH